MELTTYMNNTKIYLIEGLSGTGKTSVSEELTRRGYNAIDADEIIGFFGDPRTGLPMQDETKREWLWDKEKFKDIKEKNKDIIFICGGAMNQEDFTSHFSKVFTLQVDDETLKSRLQNRTNNDYGKNPEELSKQLDWNKGVASWSKQRGTVLIDATQSLTTIVDEILKNIEN